MKPFRTILILATSIVAIACGGGSTPITDSGGNGGVGPVGTSPQLAIRSVAQEAGSSTPSIGDGIPQGAVVASIGQTVRITGEGFSEDMRFFFGMNNALAKEDDSLLTSDAEDLPDDPFVYTDPDSGTETILEVEAEFTYVSETAIDVVIPTALSCTPDFSPTGGPVLRVTDDNGSSEPVTDVLFIVGPRAYALDPNRGAEAGGYSVVIFGGNFSPSTQIAIRFKDPASGDTRILGDGDTGNGALDADDDLVESLVDSSTIVISNWPTPGVPLGADLEVDVLVFENIDSLAANDPDLGRACDALEPEGDVELNESGSRNFELLRGFTYLPAAMSGLPAIDSLTPADGSVVGGDVVVIRGRNFDGNTVDLSDPALPGMRIEIPADSGRYFTPVSASLVDAGTLMVTMPSAPGNEAARASVWLRNRFTIQTYGDDADSYIGFGSVFSYRPLEPVSAPALTVVAGDPTDAGCQRIVLLGDRFDATVGVEILVGTESYAADRVLRHDEGVLEVFLPRLDPPLTADAKVTIRLSNAEGSADFVDALTIRATPDAGSAPTLSSLVPAGGPVGGGNRILVRGTDFDTDTGVRFGAIDSSRVDFLSSTLLIATVPAASAAGSVDVVVTDEGAESPAAGYEYGLPAIGPQVATAEVKSGHDAGGYAVVLRGTGFTPTTTVEFGGGSANMAAEVAYVDDTCLRVVAPAALSAQQGKSVALRAHDPLVGGGPDGVAFTYLAETAPTLSKVTTTAGDSDLYAHGGDRVLVQGSGFDANTGFEVTQDSTVRAGVNVHLLGADIAVFTAPAASDGTGTATLAATGTSDSSDDVDVDYIAVPVPVIDDVRTLGDDDHSATEGERLVIFGDFFYDDGSKPLVVRLTGTEAGGTEDKTVALSGASLWLVGDSMLALRIPVGVFDEGDLGIEVETASGKASFEESGSPIFSLDGAQAPRIDSVSPEVVLSAGGGFAVFTGSHLTSTTTLQVRTQRRDTFQSIRGLRVLSDSVATGYFPPLLGGMPPAGIPGIVRAEESDATRASAIDGDPYTESSFDDPLFRVIDESAPALLAVVPDHGTIDGGEQVLLLGDGFLGADGQPNVGSIVFRHPDIGPVEYERVSGVDAPLIALPGGASNGRFMVVNDSTILLVTTPRPPILLGDSLPVDVEVRGLPGNSVLMSAFTYENTPAVRTPVLAGITPNEVRRNGGSTHLVSGGFMTEVDRLVL